MPITMTVPRLSYKKVILSDNPIGYWKLDETSGNLAKDTIGTYNGTYIGNPTLNQSPLIFNGTSVYFNGTDSYVNIDPFDFDMNVGPGKQHTSEFWVKTDGNAGPVFTINLDWNSQSSQEYLVIVLPDGRLRLSTTEENMFSNASVNDNNIHHCVIVTDENTVDFYIDGEFDSTHSVVSSNTTRNVLLICARHTDDSSTVTSFTDATLDEVAVYDYPLTATQIQRHYNTGSK